METENNFDEKVKNFITSSVKIRSKLFTLMESSVTGSNIKERKDQVKQLESDCQEVKQLLDKYFAQIQDVTNILELILSNINEDTIVSNVKTWNVKLCKMNEEIVSLTSETSKKIKRKDVSDLVKLFNTSSNELLSVSLLALPQV